MTCEFLVVQERHGKPCGNFCSKKLSDSEFEQMAFFLHNNFKQSIFVNGICPSFVMKDLRACPFYKHK